VQNSDPVKSDDIGEAHALISWTASKRESSMLVSIGWHRFGLARGVGFFRSGWGLASPLRTERLAQVSRGARRQGFRARTTQPGRRGSTILRSVKPSPVRCGIRQTVRVESAEGVVAAWCGLGRGRTVPEGGAVHRAFSYRLRRRV